MRVRFRHVSVAVVCLSLSPWSSMPEYLAVRCFDCQVYQACQKRKDKKFSCKMCQKKQSVQRIYASSQIGKDIREAVMNLNMAQGEISRQDSKALEAAVNQVAEQEESFTDERFYQDARETAPGYAESGSRGASEGSAWAHFVPPDSPGDSDEGELFSQPTQYRQRTLPTQQRQSLQPTKQTNRKQSTHRLDAHAAESSTGTMYSGSAWANFVPPDSPGDSDEGECIVSPRHPTQHRQRPHRLDDRGVLPDGNRRAVRSEGSAWAQFIPSEVAEQKGSFQIASPTTSFIDYDAAPRPKRRKKLPPDASAPQRRSNSPAALLQQPPQTTTTTTALSFSAFR